MPNRLTGALFLAAALAAGPAAAATGSWTSAEIIPQEFLDARLLAAVDGTGDLATIPAGLQIRLDPGWKTYWRSPGDAGYPPTIDWTGSENLAAAELRFPAPHRFSVLGLDTFGYQDEVLLPLAVTPERPGEPVRLRGQLSALVCTDICVPVSAALALDLPAGSATPEARAANLIDRADSLVPGDGAAAGLAIARTDDDADSLLIEASAREPFAAPDIFVEAPPGWAFAVPSFAFSDEGRRAVATLVIAQRPAEGARLDGVPVVLTLIDGERSMEQAVTVAPGTPPVPAGLWLAMLGTALLGGLVLNLMPCVLPVLSMKLLAVLGHGGASPRMVRRGFLASAAGILVSFAVLAGGAIAIKAGGGALGWGIQFQQPLFLVPMIILVTLFACNLLGLFEIRLPGAVTAGVGRMGGQSLAGHFATGVFATLLATPCSAPFLGTALGFALSRGAPEIGAIFLAVGLGLALPYIAVAALPRLVAWLPRPGAWMVRLRQLLSLALVATALWLLSVLAALETGLAAALTGLLMVALALLLWSRHRTAGRLRLASGLGAGIAALAALAMPLAVERAATARPVTEAAWAPFDRARIAELVVAGRTVFVDVTAEWCLTCRANELLVLDRDPVAGALGAPGIVAMRADWTRPDDGIARYLAENGRYGIPFNIVYGPGAAGGIALPELLDAEAVLDALGRAAEG